MWCAANDVVTSVIYVGRVGEGYFLKVIPYIYKLLIETVISNPITQRGITLHYFSLILRVFHQFNSKIISCKFLWHIVNVGDISYISGCGLL